MDPVTALRQIAYYKDRNRHDPRRVMAYRNAADIIEGLDDAARQRHGQANSWQSLAGIGPKTAKVIAQAWSGREPDLLAELRADAEDLGGGAIRAALRGDLHLHSNWSDGSAPIEEMMATAAALGHQYCALTDHSPRLTIANGLSPDRLRKQLDVIDELREKFAPLRILTGIEVDILEDGSLDQEPEMLDRLDIVVASVHSKLSMDSAAMTRRMVRAVANGHTDVLGHCTGRLIAGNRGIRPESKFDAEVLSALGRMQRAGALTVAYVDAALEELRQVPVTRHGLSSLLAGAWSRRDTLRLTDALYVELAETAGLVLLTTDERLARAWPSAHAIG